MALFDVVLVDNGSGSFDVNLSISTGVSGSQSDAASAADSIDSTLSSSRSLTEAGSASDSQSSQVASSHSQSESGSAADSQGASLSSQRSVSENASASETQDAQLPITGSVSESATSQDSQSVLLAAVGSISESAPSTESQNAQRSTSSSQSESASATESVNSTIDKAASISESASSTDVQSTLINAQVSISESATAQEVQSAFMPIPASQSDSTSPTDQQSAQVNTSATLSESASGTSDEDAVIITAGSISETGSASDEQSVQLNTSASVEEQLSADTSESASMIFSVSAEESANASELTVGAKPSGQIYEVFASHILGSGRQLEFTHVVRINTLYGEHAVFQSVYKSAHRLTGITLPIPASITESGSSADAIIAATQSARSLSELASALDLTNAGYIISSGATESASSGEDSDAYVSMLQEEFASAADQITVTLQAVASRTESTSAGWAAEGDVDIYDYYTGNFKSVEFGCAGGSISGIIRAESPLTVGKWYEVSGGGAFEVTGTTGIGSYDYTALFPLVEGNTCEDILGSPPPPPPTYTEIDISSSTVDGCLLSLGDINIPAWIDTANISGATVMYSNSAGSAFVSAGTYGAYDGTQYSVEIGTDGAIISATPC